MQQLAAHLQKERVMYNTAPINEAMGRERLSNDRVAEMAGLDPATVSRIRNGNPNATLSSLKKVADALSLSLEIRFTAKAEQTQEEEPAAALG
jgi:transcriptional regulator with XRE-family HTH domain